MFGLSLAKVLLIALVIGAVWYGLRAYRRHTARTAAKTAAEAQRKDLHAAAEAMVKCPQCGAYNPAGARCPHRS